MFSPPHTQNVDKWSFDVFALNEASGDHALKFIFYELLTRYDLISRFKVKKKNAKTSNNEGGGGRGEGLCVSFKRGKPSQQSGMTFAFPPAWASL